MTERHFCRSKWLHRGEKQQNQLSFAASQNYVTRTNGHGVHCTSLLLCCETCLPYKIQSFFGRTQQKDICRSFCVGGGSVIFSCWSFGPLGRVRFADQSHAPKLRESNGPVQSFHFRFRSENRYVDTRKQIL